MCTYAHTRVYTHTHKLARLFISYSRHSCSQSLLSCQVIYVVFPWGISPFHSRSWEGAGRRWLPFQGPTGNPCLERVPYKNRSIKIATVKAKPVWVRLRDRRFSEHGRKSVLSFSRDRSKRQFWCVTPYTCSQPRSPRLSSWGIFYDMPSCALVARLLGLKITPTLTTIPMNAVSSL